MTAGEFNKRQLQKSIALLLEEEPKTQRERDIFNLKQIRYSIRHGNDWYRYGVIASLLKTKTTESNSVEKMMALLLLNFSESWIF